MAALDHDYDRVVLVVAGLLVILLHLLVRDGTVEFVEMVSRILERRRVSGVVAHPGGELFNGDVGAEIDGVSGEVGRVEFGLVNPNHRPASSLP